MEHFALLAAHYHSGSVEAMLSEHRTIFSQDHEKLFRQLELTRQALFHLNVKLTAFQLVGSTNKPLDSLNSTLQQLLSFLTKREREVALAFMKLGSDTAVAKQLGIAAQTVRNQIASIQNKLSIGSREELILLLLSTDRAENQVVKWA